MNIIDSSANCIATIIRKNNPNAASHAMLFYSLSLLINSTLTLLIVLLFSAFTGYIVQAIEVIVLYTLLRYVSGGTHFSSSLVCCLFSSFKFILSSHLQFSYIDLGIYMDILSISILLFTAPFNIKDISTIPEKYYPILKIASVGIVASNFFFQASFLSVAFLIQALQTTKLAEKLIQALERRWEK
ncbi:accessory gene regulator B family protein [Paenibacillus silviterrae]|uniref:accessory gene regulator B family protein n=1 Tax=Paenibacillus silviterrae TaxID=3242194 RepID=UPI002542950E|nr:accessory gene regulator B family protein [Paenibacillus chinjuensis]